MISVPGFLLRRLYVRGSLRNQVDGFEFRLKNTLGSGYASEMFPLIVDGRELPLADTVFRAEDGTQTTSFAAVNGENPFTLQMNRIVVIQVRGQQLSPGEHKIGMSFLVRGVGRLSFDFTDTVS